MPIPILRSEAGGRALVELAADRELAPEVLEALLDAIERHAGKLSRRGLFQEFDSILDRAGV
ncbi:MAG: hypothetical protein ACXWUZ_03825 [Allosphingosinicella sp.]